MTAEKYFYKIYRDYTNSKYWGHAAWAAAQIEYDDRNYPAAEHARRLIRADGIALEPMLRAVLGVFPVEAAYRAALNNDPAQAGAIHQRIDALLQQGGRAATPLAGEALYPRIRSAYAIVATSEPALFANVILRKAALSSPNP